MSNLKEIYHLKNNHKYIDCIQKASLRKKVTGEFLGFKIENNLLFGTKPWFQAVENGVVNSIVVNGVISRVYMSGHNDFPQFEIKNSEGTSQWDRDGDDNAYIVGKTIELTYIESEYRRPNFNSKTSKCVYKIRIEE